MNTALVFGTLLNAVVFVLFGFSAREFPILTAIMGSFFAVSVLGVVLVGAGARKPGAILSMVGSIVFIPAGVVAAVGARAVLDELAGEEFERRRLTDYRRGTVGTSCSPSMTASR